MFLKKILFFFFFSIFENPPGGVGGFRRGCSYGIWGFGVCMCVALRFLGGWGRRFIACVQLESERFLVFFGFCFFFMNILFFFFFVNVIWGVFFKIPGLE